MKNLILAVVMAMILGGCATMTHIVNPQPKAPDLTYNEADVLAEIEAIKKLKAEDPDAVTYDAKADRYTLKSKTYKNAVKDGIIKRVQEKKINAFLKDYDRETILDAMKKDGGTIAWLLIILAILGVLAL